VIKDDMISVINNLNDI